MYPGGKPDGAAGETWVAEAAAAAVGVAELRVANYFSESTLPGGRGTTSDRLGSDNHITSIFGGSETEFSKIITPSSTNS